MDGKGMESWEMFEAGSPVVPEDPGLATFFWHLYRRNLYTDVVFELEGTSFSAHKLVLSIWSPKFADMVRDRNVISIKGVDPGAFEDMLKAMYLSYCEPALADFERACKLFKVATEFEVTHVANLCMEFIGSIEVDVTNVFDVTEMARTLGDETLTRKCEEIVRQQTKDIISRHDCCDLSPSAVGVILDSKELALDSEFDLLLWVFAWAKNRLEDLSRYQRLREVLQEFLPQLRFLDLTNKEFATICKIHEQFFDDKEALSIFMNIAIRGSYPLPSWYNKDLKSRKYNGQRDDGL